MPKKKTYSHEYLLNPLVGLAPIIVVSICEIIFGLNVALHIGILLSIVIMFWNYMIKAVTYQPLLLVNAFIFAGYQYWSVHLVYIPEGTMEETMVYHGLILINIAIFFFMREPLFAFFAKQYSGTSKHMESNLREFYFVSRFLFVVMAYHPIVFLLSLFVSGMEDVYKNPIVDYVEAGLLLSLVIFEMIRLSRIKKLLSAEEFWPIVNTSGVVIGKVAKSITLIPSKNKELHPVVRVHIIHEGMLYLYKSTGEQGESDWDCAINEHVLYGENMEQCIQRIAVKRYGLKNVKPNFLLKHVVEQHYENQYILLYYLNDVRNLSLVNENKGQLKPWPMWQIEENLQKGVFSEAFEIEYEYIKNTVLLAEEFSRSLIEE